LRIVLDKIWTFRWVSTMFCFRQTWNNCRHIKIIWQSQLMPHSI